MTDHAPAAATDTHSHTKSRVEWSDGVGLVVIVLFLLAIVAGGLKQAAEINSLRERLESVEVRVTEANLSAWRPWSSDVTARLERLETKVDRLAEHPTP